MKNRLDYIDGLKGICAIGVFSLHYYGDLCNNNLPFKAYGLFQRGWLAVELFFMLSGFLLADKWTEQPIKITFVEYICPKLRRIMPCFLLSNVIVIIFSLIDQCAIHSQILPKVNLWRAINGSVPFNFGWVRLDSPYSHPAWFISVLFLMYTIYYYILRIKNKYPFTYVPLCIIMVFGGWSLLELNWKIPFLYNWTARGYLCFFLGVLLSILFKQKFNKRLISKISVVLLTLLFVLIHRHGAESVLGNVRYSFIFIIFPLLLLAITELIVLQKMLSLPPIVYLGRISMSIYLLHVPVFKTIKWLSCMLGGGIINFAVPSVYVVVLIITIMVSTYEYEICEKRLFQRYLPNIISLLKKEG